MYKAVGQQFPSVSEIKNCAESNPDGFGIMWNYNGKVQSYRTLSEGKFLKLYEKIAKMDPNKTACVVHCRIATHGSLKVSNCHCWIEKKSGIGFAHNGVLSIDNRDDMTDSETFFRDLFVPAYRYGGWDAGDKAVRACIGTSRFAFLMPNGTIVAYGKYEENKEGVKYSNGSWKTSYRLPKKTTFSFYDDDYDFGYRNSGYEAYQERIEKAMDWFKQRPWYNDFLSHLSPGGGLYWKLYSYMYSEVPFYNMMQLKYYTDSYEVVKEWEKEFKEARDNKKF